MAKLARPVQEISEFLEQSLYYCVLIEKINKFPFVVISAKLNAVKKNRTIGPWLIWECMKSGGF